MRLPESVTKIQPVGAVLKASEAGEALLREAGERVNAQSLTGDLFIIFYNVLEGTMQEDSLLYYKCAAYDCVAYGCAAYGCAAYGCAAYRSSAYGCFS